MTNFNYITQTVLQVLTIIFGILAVPVIFTSPIIDNIVVKSLVFFLVLLIVILLTWFWGILYKED